MKVFKNDVNGNEARLTRANTCLAVYSLKLS